MPSSTPSGMLNFKDAVCWRTGLSKKLTLTETVSINGGVRKLELSLTSSDRKETWTRTFRSAQELWDWVFEGPDNDESSS